MKTRNLFFGLFAALAIAGCSSEDAITSDGGNSEVGDGDSRYLTVNIVNTDGNSTRAAGGQTQDGSTGIYYEEGLSNENTVNNVRFYFFDDNGNAVTVRVNGTNAVNYVDCSGSGNNTAMPNIEKKLEATLVIETYKGAPLPTKMVAVLNATGNDLSTTTLDQNLSLGDLQAILSNGTKSYIISKNVDGVTTEYFVMSSSSYLNAAGEVACATTEVNTHLTSTEVAAKENPAMVYVERTAAKARVKLDTSDTDKWGTVSNNGYLAKRASSTENWQYTEGTEKKDIYVNFLGWNLTNVSTKSYLFKKIEKKWNDNITASVWNGSWNYSESTSDNQISYRCFWAENPSDNTLDNTGVKWSGTTAYTWKSFYTSESDRNSNLVYCLENAAENSDGGKPNYDADTKLSNRTQVVIKAQLQDKNGNAIDIAQWQGALYTRETVESMMKEQAALVLYDKDGKNITTGINYKFVPAQQAVHTSGTGYMADGNSQNSKRYMTYIQYSSGTAVGSIYRYVDGKLTPFTSVNELNSYLSKIAPSKVWYGGKTYFYTDIKHLGLDNLTETTGSGNNQTTVAKYNVYGQYGVVRNHIYDVTINSFTGIGTPATFDPNNGTSGADVEIIPQKTLEEDWYIYAKVNILSWRVVSNSTTLDW